MSEKKFTKSRIDAIGRKNRRSSDLSNYVFDKLPPQAVEIEEAVLGALLIDKDAISSVIDILKAKSFYVEAHQKIYECIQGLFANSKAIDLLTVTENLKKLGILAEVGGPFYLTQLTNRVASAANIEHHAHIVAEKYILRELIRTSNQVIRDAYEDTTDVFDLLDRTEQSLFEITEQNVSRNFEQMTSLVPSALKKIDETRNSDQKGIVGIPSGFTELDSITAGWQRSDLIIIAARPAMGKTAFTLALGRNAAVDHNMPIAIFSLEMSALQLVNRLMSGEAHIPGEMLKKGTLDDNVWNQLTKKVEKLSSAPIYIDDTPGINIFELRAKCRRLKMQYDIQMIIIDYLQLMSGTSDKKGNREQEISSISRSLKGIAKELNVPVIALSQLSRAVETRGGDKKPMLSDLRESGAIEQDADMVLFLYRPEYYGFDQDDQGNPTAGVAEVIIAKHRHGAIGTIRTRFISSLAKFTDQPIEASIDGYVPLETVIKSSKMNQMNTPPQSTPPPPPNTTQQEENPFNQAASPPPPPYNQQEEGKDFDVPF